ncbi:MAG TPA: hypothetical protein VN946_19570 [Terriglobales bacterium]|jgi:hypothetical protein|nr:hypothetical protein [Terriglobales bacterium]
MKTKFIALRRERHGPCDGHCEDRLVKRMRWKKIKTRAEANLFLQNDGAAGGGVEEVFHLETRRILGNDGVVRHDNHYFQVQAQSRNYAPAKSRGDGVRMGRWALTDSLLRSGGALGADSRRSPGSNTPGGQGRKSKKRDTSIVVRRGTFLMARDTTIRGD